MVASLRMFIRIPACRSSRAVGKVAAQPRGPWYLALLLMLQVGACPWLASGTMVAVESSILRIESAVKPSGVSLYAAHNLTIPTQKPLPDIAKHPMARDPSAYKIIPRLIEPFEILDSVFMCTLGHELR